MAGIVALLVSTLLFPMSDIAAKALTAQFSGVEVTWMRYVVFVLTLIPFAIRGRSPLACGRPRLQVLRGVSSATATAFAITAFGMLPVADATAIGFITPVIVTGLAVIMLKETVSWRRWLGALVGFCGVMVVVQPGGNAFQAATLLPLAGSLFSAITAITTRSGKADRVGTTLLYSALVGLLLTSVALPFVWRQPTIPQMQLAFLMGLLAAGATLAQVMAYRWAPASLLAPFSYTQLIWAGGLGWLVFGTTPGPAMLAGCVIIAASGTISALPGGRSGKAAGVRSAGGSRLSFGFR